MEFTCARRKSNPVIGRLIWEAIQNLQEGDSSYSKKDVKGIIVKLADLGSTMEHVEIIDQMEKMVGDELLVPSFREKTDTSEEDWEFGIPMGISIHLHSKIRKPRDWYCFECHQPGYIASCRTCFRSYHLNCLSEAPRVNDQVVMPDGEDWTCPWCVHVKSSAHKYKNKEILFKSIKILLEMISAEHKILETKIMPLQKNFVFRHASFEKIKDLAKTNLLHSPEAVELEIRNIVHNYHCYHGPNHGKTARAEAALVTTIEFIGDMEGCLECFLNKYQSADGTVDDKWRLQACNPAHPICLAKHKTFGPTPAKILSSLLAQRVYVMFFAGKPEKVLIDRGNIGLLTNLNENFNKQRKNGFVKHAYTELRDHIRSVKKRLGNDAVRRVLDLEMQNDAHHDGDTPLAITENGNPEIPTERRNLRTRDSPDVKDSLNDLGLFVERDDKDSQTDPCAFQDTTKIASLQAQVERLRRENNDMSAKHKSFMEREIDKIKKKNWCTGCWKEARYHCCAAFFYCGVECQRSAWRDGHKDTCKKRRENSTPTQKKRSANVPVGDPGIKKPKVDK